MEIIHLVLGKANPQRMNGVNKVVHELATRQAQAGEHVQVWGITGNPVHDYPARAYTTQLFKTAALPFDLPASLIAAIKTKKGNAVFHLHGGFIPAMYGVARVLQRSNIPFVFTPHGSYNTIAMEKSGLRKKIYFTCFEKYLLKAASRIHVLGKSELTGLQAIFPNNKSYLIPYGFELTGITEVKPPVGEFIIGYCGRIDIHTKGLKELLQGFRQFHNQYPASRLWIIGDGGEMPRLRTMIAELQFGQEVVLHGAQYGADKYNLLQQCHVFAAPSRNEGLPTAVLEAASLGIPCLVTEATNTGDCIRAFEAGQVIEHTDPHEIYTGLQQLYLQLSTTGRQQRYSGNARRMIGEVFNWQKVLAQFNQLYA